MVIPNPDFHLVQLGRFAPCSSGLSQASYAGPNCIALFIAGQGMPVLRVQRNRVGARPNNAHVAGQYIQELGHLVEVRLAEEPADACYPHVILGSLMKLRISVVGHRPKFQAGKHSSVSSCSGLHEDGRS